LAKKATVLFICSRNSARSQMAEGFLKHLYGRRYEAHSGGTEPSQIHPLAVEVMKEVGIDISSQTSKSLDTYLHKEIDYVVTVCDKARQSCPFFPGGRTGMHKSFEDPARVKVSGQRALETFRRVRDEIKEWIKETFGEKLD